MSRYIEKISTNCPVIITKDKMDEYFSRAIQSQFIVLVVTKDGITFEGNEKERVHPDIVEKRLQPEDKVFGFIVNDILKEKDKRRISYLSISYGSFHISAFKIPKSEDKRQYEYWYNPFAVTYHTSLLATSLKQFSPMEYSIANGIFSATDDMENSLKIPFYRNQIIQSLRNRQIDDPEKLFKNENEKTSYINELINRFTRIKIEALKLLRENSFETFNINDLDIYEILKRRTNFEGNEILKRLEKLANCSQVIEYN